MKTIKVKAIAPNISYKKYNYNKDGVLLGCDKLNPAIGEEFEIYEHSLNGLVNKIEVIKSQKFSK